MPRTKKTTENKDIEPQESTAGTTLPKSGKKPLQIDFVPGITQLEDVINQINAYFRE